jgi:hypothetical protein
MKTETWKADARLSEILKICLATEGEVPVLMRKWESQYDVSVIDGGLIRYIPFLFKRLHELKIVARDYDIFKGAYFKSWWVQMVFHKKNIDFLGSISGDFPKFSLLKGIALQNTAYAPDPRTRPCEDVDIFVLPEHLWTAIDYLQKVGFTPDSPYSLNYVTKFRKSISFTKDDVSLDLNWGLYEYSKSNNYLSKMQYKKILIDNNDFYVLDSTYNLIHTFLHGTGWNSTPSTRWIIDAALLIRSGQISWDEFEEVIIENGWQYPLSLQINYLEEFGIFVPSRTKNIITLIKPDFFSKAMYFYQRQSSRTVRRALRLIYSDYLSYLTNRNLHNSVINYISIQPVVIYYLIVEYAKSFKGHS